MTPTPVTRTPEWNNLMQNRRQVGWTDLRTADGGPNTLDGVNHGSLYYQTPNLALSDGSIDANFFQHVPFFDEQVASKGYKLEHGTGILQAVTQEDGGLRIGGMALGRRARRVECAARSVHRQASRLFLRALAGARLPPARQPGDPGQPPQVRGV